MIISNSFEVGADRERVFRFLRDVSSLAPCLPGCQDVTEVQPDQYSAVIAVGIAFMKLKFNVTVTVEEATSPSYLKAKISGKPMALAGQLTMLAEMNLEEINSASTKVAYNMDLTLTGKLGSIGNAAFRSKSEEMGAQFAQNLKAALEGTSEVKQ